MRERFAAWVGVDWADQCHWVCLREAGSERVEKFPLEQEPEALHRWLVRLGERFAGRPVAVAVEQTRGPLLCALMEYPFLTLYPVNPKAFASYRSALRLSGAKDDPDDAQLLQEFVRCHHRQMRAWRPAEPELRALRKLVEQRRLLVQERERLGNRLRDLLKGYFPQVLQWFAEISRGAALAFLSRWPTLQQAQRARPRTLREFWRRQRRSAAKQEWILKQIRQAVALTHDPAVLQVHPLLVQTAVDQLQAMQRGIERLEQEIATCFEQHPDAYIFQSFLGAGKALAPRLLVAFGSDRDRFDAQQMQCFSGIAPVTQRSGTRCWVHHRWICPKFLKQTFHEFAERSIPKSRWANAFYHHRRNQGASQHQAIRALAFKWIRILTRCWKDRTPYCEETYLRSLRKANSPLIALIEEREAA